jgi:hypothetical protein
MITLFILNLYVISLVYETKLFMKIRININKKNIHNFFSEYKIDIYFLKPSLS